MHLPAAALVLLGAFACCLALATADGLHITWLPLGDSITWGCGNGVLPHVTPPGCRATRKHLNDCGCERDSGSYRIPVAQALEQWNITTTTVGSLTAGPASSPAAWQQHEGHPGWTIEQVASISAQWTKTKPDVITIHLGTNDSREPPATAVAAMRALLKTIGAALPTANVFVASILRMPAAHGAFVTQYNAAIPGLVQAAGGNFHYVPLYENTSLVCGDNKHQYSIGDGVHPNPFGHLQVGSVFARTIAATLCPAHTNDHSC
jgi:lysophospholipase L1-like esterase